MTSIEDVGSNPTVSTMALEQDELLTKLREREEKLAEALRNCRTHIKAILAQKAREEYACSCVRLNRDIDVWDMSEQSEKNRYPLGLGLVSETLSADRNCHLCDGKGKIVHGRTEAKGRDGRSESRE